MSDSPDPAMLVSILNTEHYNLQLARGSTVSEASGRTSTYLGIVSGVLVALSLLAATIKLGPAFTVTALLLGVILLFLGVITFQRLLEAGVADMHYGQGINRIRRYYLDCAPQLRPYIQQSGHDDAVSVMANMGLASRSQVPFTGAVGVMGVTATLAGGVVGTLLTLLHAPAWLAVGGAVAALVLCAAALLYYQKRYWAAFNRRSRPMFPAPSTPA